MHVATEGNESAPEARTIGRYQVVRRLACGGMAELFLAYPAGSPERRVALKRVLPHLGEQGDFVAMFLDEARIAATLDHENVVRTLEVGRDDQSFYLAMEYLEGHDLRSLRRRLIQLHKRLSLEHALQIVIGVCAGLHYAHERKDKDGRPLEIVHRDISPQNVFLTTDGRVKLLDFGIAKACNRTTETRTGTLKGKIPYMSPEQCRGEPLDRRSDLFSLGNLLYELTVWRKLFAGTNDFQVLRQVLSGQFVRPQKADPAYPPELEAIVLKALAPEAGDRYASAHELQLDLERFAARAGLSLSSAALAEQLQQELRSEAPLDSGEGSGEVELGVDRPPLEKSAPRLAPAPLLALPEEPLLPVLPEDPEPPSSIVVEAPPARSRRALWALPLLALLGVGALFALAPRHHALPPALVQQPAPAPAAPVPELGVVAVSTTPPGATIYLDGEKLPQLSPCTLDRIAAGAPHVILFQLSGHTDVVQRFSVAPRDVQRVEASLLPLRAPRPAPHRSTTAILGGRSARASSVKAPPATPQPPPAPAAPLTGEGTLVVASSPWCNVIVDKVNRGPTPLLIKLPAGPHQVVLDNPEFKIRRAFPVQILPKETVRKSLDFGAPGT